MVGDVVRVGVTDEHEFLFRPVRIEPKAQAWKINSSFTIMEFQCRHSENLEFQKRNFQFASAMRAMQMNVPE